MISGDLSDESGGRDTHHDGTVEEDEVDGVVEASLIEEDNVRDDLGLD